MKTFIITAIMLLSLSINSQTTQDVLSPKQMTVTWLGVDFTHGHYELGNVSPEYLPDYISRINKEVREDHHRYYFPIAYKKDFVYNTSYIDNLNAAITNSVAVDRKKDFKELDAKQIKDIVSQYQFPEDLKGVGLIYIYDYVTSKGNDKARIWMTYINIETKEVLFMQNTECGLYGKTFEESYASPVLSMLRDTKKDIIKWNDNPERFNLANK